MKLIETFSSSAYPEERWFKFKHETMMLEWSYTLNKHFRLV